jgi:hypothetical protein
MFKKYLVTIVVLLNVFSAKSQFLMDLLDTTKEAGKGMVGIYNKFDHLRIGGYIQPQFQVATQKGVKSFESPDFAPNVSNKFLLRRSRIRIDYLHNNDLNQPGVQIVFQFDVNERGFTIRDVWGRVFENKFQLFSLTTGMFARPFSYELNLSSSDRESPERGRMSQILMKSERDLGAMLTFEPRKKGHPLRHIKIDAGFFNGQGINAAGDFDNRKDFVGRISLKPVRLGRHSLFSASGSYLNGGLLQNTKYTYSTVSKNGQRMVEVDSSVDNKGKYSPRQYTGADAQLKFHNALGDAELRAEYIFGTQTGTANNSETPVALLNGFDGFHKRKFNGAYFYYIQQLWSKHNQLILKYDWYDPDSGAGGKQIGMPGSNLAAASIKYSTFNFGLLHHISQQAKLFLFYAIVKNEQTSLPGFTADVSDNIFTCRLQFRF